MNKQILIFALLIGASLCYNETNITVIPSDPATASNYKDINTLLNNITQACGQVDNCNVYLQTGVNHYVGQNFTYATRTVILFIRPNGAGLANLQLNNGASVNVAGGALVQLIGINLQVNQTASPAVINLSGAGSLYLTDSRYSANFSQLFAQGTQQGGLNLKNVTASINIQGTNFVQVDNGAIFVDQLTLNNVAGYRADQIFYIKNSNSVSLKTLVINGGNVSALYAENSAVNVSINSKISGLTQPSYVIYLLNSQLNAAGLEISNIDLTSSVYQNAIRAVDSLLRLDNYVCSNLVSSSYPCFLVNQTKNSASTGGVVPLTNSNFNNNKIQGNYAGLALINTVGSSAYYYGQFNSQRQLLGNNQFANNVYQNSSLNSQINIRFSGQYDLQVTVSKADGSADAVTNNNTQYIYNVNPAQQMFNSISIKYTDVLGQLFDDPAQLTNINNSYTVMYLVAPHKNKAFTINAQNGNSTQVSNVTDLLTALRNTDIFRGTYVIPNADACAQKSFDLKNSLSYQFNGLGASLSAGPLADSPTTTWYLVAQLNLDQDGYTLNRTRDNFLNLNGSLYTLPLKLADKTCDNGQGLVCKSNQFINSTDGCQNCDSSCGTCQAAGKDKCITCSNAILVAQKGRCVCDDSSQVLINGNCFSQGDARSLLEGYDFSAVNDIVDLQTKYRVALSYAQVISKSGLNISTPASPCGNGDKCSFQGNCQYPQNAQKYCLCDAAYAGSLCQFDKNEFSKVLVRAQNASQALAAIAIRNSTARDVSATQIQNEILGTVLITQILESLNQQTLGNLNDALNSTSEQANRNINQLSLDDFENLIDQLDLTLNYTLAKFNSTSGLNNTRTLFVNLKTNTLSRVKKDFTNMQANINSPITIVNDRITIQYTLFQLNNTNQQAYVQNIGSNNYSLPLGVMSVIKGKNNLGTQVVLTVTAFTYNPLAFEDEFQAQSNLLLSNIYQGPQYDEFTIDTNQLNSQAITVNFGFNQQFANNAKCYQYNNNTKLWYFRSVGNFSGSLNCTYTQLGLYGASNSTKGTVNGVINSFNYILFGFIAAIYVMLH